LRRPFRFLRVDNEAELTNDRLSEGQIAGHVFLRLGDEKEIVEVTDGCDALLGQGEMDDGEQLCADPRRRAQSKWHINELVQPAFELEAKELAHRRVQRERQETIGQVQLAVPTAGKGGLYGIVHAAVTEIVVL